jgi:hypothetical protein
MRQIEKTLFFSVFLLLFISLLLNYNQITVINKLEETNTQINETFLTNTKYLMFLNNNFEASLRKHYKITYWRTNIEYPPDDRGHPYALIYVFEPNSTLEMSFIMHHKEKGLFIPLSIQRGNAFNSTEVKPSIYNVKIDSSNNLNFELRKTGWYTISLTGNIVGVSGRSYPGVIRNGVNQTVMLFDLDLLINVKSKDKYNTIFGLDDKRSSESP